MATKHGMLRTGEGPGRRKNKKERDEVNKKNTFGRQFFEIHNTIFQFKNRLIISLLRLFGTIPTLLLQEAYL